MAENADSSATIVVGLDFGTTYTGIAYSIRIVSGQQPEHTIQQAWRVKDQDGHVSDWPGDKRMLADGKVPSVVEYERNDRGKPVLVRWGDSVKENNNECSFLFKLNLEENLDKTRFPYSILNSVASKGVFYIPDGKNERDVTQEYLKEVWDWAKVKVRAATRQRIGDFRGFQYPVHFTITVPDSWTRKTRALMAEIVRGAGLPSAERDTLTVIPEPVAAAVKILSELPDNMVMENDAIIICDIGGGTVDVGSVIILPTRHRRYIRQPQPVGDNSGMLSAEAGFYRTMVTRFGEAFRNKPLEDIGSYTPFIHAFRAHLQSFTADKARTSSLRFTVPLELELGYDNPNIYDRGRGNIKLTSQDLRSFLDPVVRVAVNLIEKQADVVAKAGFGSGLKRVYLVGGGAKNAYIKDTITTEIQNRRGLTVDTPGNPQLAVVYGAAAYSQRHVLSIHHCPLHIGLCGNQPHRRQDQTIRDPVDGSEKRCGLVTWVLRMDEKYDEGPVRPLDFIEYFLNGAIPSTRYMDIYPSNAENPPQAVFGLPPIKNAIKIRFGDVPVRLRENRIINQQMQCRVRYKVTTTFLPIENRLEFEVKVGNQEIGRHGIDIPYS
ncbi:hypothetical protein ASPBRDRAFT_331019 [Aspergillus brasiliensis CBS 101740]|uniref:Uncharacterized protein n=1 Tax=Aspergillus brasiliensis (strain CBS 101740 / IMI 381727 / IBT 21946) TaxID=767769 RepID=A0A1L9U8K5_ASPBC|nr:hypothetical protein ASPBRDRAFT_331019 [Aspergillus brasiliensis CBS 101740]